MADLNDLQSADAVKIVGSNLSGVEQSPVNSTAQGALYTSLRNSTGGELGVISSPVKTSSELDTQGVTGAITVTNSAPVAVRVGVSNLASRKLLIANNNGGQILYWGFSSGVTASTGMPLPNGESITWPVGPNITVFIIATSGSRNVRVAEIA